MCVCVGEGELSSSYRVNSPDSLFVIVELFLALCLGDEKHMALCLFRMELVADSLASRRKDQSAFISLPSEVKNCLRMDQSVH